MTMTFANTSAPAPAGIASVVRTWPQAVVGHVVGWFTYLRDRRELQKLGQFSDAELRDVGLCRGDLYAVREENNPTAVLGQIVSDRRRYSRA